MININAMVSMHIEEGLMHCWLNNQKCTFFSRGFNLFVNLE